MHITELRRADVKASAVKGAVHGALVVTDVDDGVHGTASAEEGTARIGVCRLVPRPPALSYLLVSYRSLALPRYLIPLPPMVPLRLSRPKSRITRPCTSLPVETSPEPEHTTPFATGICSSTTHMHLYIGTALKVVRLF